MRISTGLLVGVICGLVGSMAQAAEPLQRTLSFEDRVKAQRAIERVYYGHQLGTTKPFDEAVRTSVLEAKVHKYLDQTAALNAYWKTAVTDQTLQRELVRMAQGTKMPERLLELYAALGNDPFLVKECLARPALVDRLTHNFYAFDPTMHVKAKAQAEGIHSQLVSGALSASAEHPNRTVSELVVGETEPGRTPSEQTAQRLLTADEFKTRRAELPARPGVVSDIQETHDAFVFSVVLSETKKSVRVASYVVAKTAWDEWWEAARGTVRGDAVTAVASDLVDLPAPRQSGLFRPSTTCADDGWDNGSLAGPPAARARHTAVWTGNEMLIWGGNTYPLLNLIGINTGGRYDPTTDSWASMSTTGAPIGRRLHSAVWAGNRMVVWGGVSPDYPSAVGLNSGGRYDPQTDSWTLTSKTGAPSARSGHTAVWTGSRMVVWGGNSTNDYSPLGTGGSYDPETDSWTATSVANAPSARNQHTAVWTGSRMVVWGGSATGRGNNFLNSGGSYDPTTDVWTPTSTANAPSARSGHTAFWTGNRMVVWSGSSVASLSNGTAYPNYVTTGGRYDPLTDTWAATSTVNAPLPLTGSSTVWTGTVMIVWGGAYGHDLNTGARYDPASDRWTATSTQGAPSGRQYHSAVWTGDLMIVWGGLASGQVPLESGGRYNPATNTWTPTSVSTGGVPVRAGHTAVWTGSLMVAWGGSAGNWPYEYYLDTGSRYDPATDSWAPMTTGGAATGRTAHTAVWTGSQMVVWGGYAGGYEYLSTGGRYDPAADAWTPMAALDAPSGREWHTAVWTGSLMLIWGGHGQGSSNDSLDTGGRYDPASNSWTPTSMSGAPTPRYRHTSVWTGRVMVVWGGSSSPNGGRYDPTSDSWTATSTAGAPSPRSGPLSVWTGSRMVVWGGSCTSDCSVGGQYDPVGDSWTPTSAIGAPSYGTHTAVWSGKLMLVWGATAYPRSTYVNSGRRYDPSTNTWSPFPSSAEPSARAGHTAVWADNLMIVWGGINLGFFETPIGTGGRYAVETVADDDCDDDGFTNSAGDCDDHDPSSFPGAPQLCDGRNNDCSDPAWPTAPAGEADSDGDGFHLCQADCDDAKATVFPGAPQLCDGLNNDCNDPAWPTPAPNEVDVDGDAARICNGDCDDANPRTAPGLWEFCDGVDNDCSGVADDGAVLQNCDDQNICTDNVCNGAAGCSNPFNTSPCDDANACTSGDVCDNGHCEGTLLTGTSCSDGDACTADDTCVNGVCSSGPEVNCDDNNACTEYEFCSADHGCWPGRPVDCNDGNPCTDDSCDPATGCKNTANAKTCDDGNPCTTNEICADSVCHVTPTSGNACNDYDECTTNDRCEKGLCRGGEPLECDDANVCNGVEYCVYYLGCVAGYPLYCNDGNFCTDDLCDPTTGCFTTANSLACDDASQCTSNDVCSGGQCLGTPDTGAACDDYNTCTTDDACGADGACHGTLVNCDDGNACNGTEVCYPYYGCYPGSPLYCDDGNICTTDSCNPATGCVHVDSVGRCDDGNTCTVDDTCGAGVCAGTPRVCDDHIACTTDTCTYYGCVFVSNPSACNDNNPCTDDSCDLAAGGCVNANDDANACSDGNACTRIDECHSGACVSSNPIQCGGGCPDGSTVVGGLCQKTYNIDEGLLDNQDFLCDGTGPNRYNNCNGLNYGFHWADLAGSLAEVTHVDVQFASGVTCGGGTRSVTLNGAFVGHFELVGSCACASLHGSISMTNLVAGAYAPGETNRISIGPSSACEGLSEDETLDNQFARVTVTYRPVTLTCRAGLCDPGTGACGVSDLPDGTECTDDNACTTGDMCSAGSCGGTSVNCDDNNPCTDDSCDPSTGCAHLGNTAVCDDGNACTTGDACAGGTCNGSGAVVCEDGNACNGIEHCDPALGCVAGTRLVCNDGNPCTDDACDPGTGCVFTNNTSGCDDGNGCTRTDVCSGGACVGGNSLSCAALDQCHDPGVCSPATGTCSNPTKANGTTCNDASLCTTGETCQSGACTPASSGLNHPAPKSAGYYKKLCQQREHNPSHYQDDQLTEADALCVGQLTATFGGMTTVDALCEVINTDHRPPHGGRHHGGSGDGSNGKDCDKAEDELIATALNICRARVCEEQNLDSNCHGNSHTTVSQSFADADAILDDAARDKDTCKDARCELREINNGHALEMNSLALSRESNKVRLTWSSPVLDDGSGAPSKYELWRRPMGSNDAFVKIGTTSGLTYVDATAGTAAWEYDITAIIPGD